MCYFRDFFAFHDKVREQFFQDEVEISHVGDFLYALSYVSEKFDELLVTLNRCFSRFLFLFGHSDLFLYDLVIFEMFYKISLELFHENGIALVFREELFGFLGTIFGRLALLMK